MKKIKKEQVEIKYKEAHNEVVMAYMSIRNTKIKLGEYFFKLKKEVGHGNFISIIENEYSFLNIRTVQNYISAYKNNLELEEA